MAIDLEVAVAYWNGFLEGRRKTASYSTIPCGRNASKGITDSVHARTHSRTRAHKHIHMIHLNNANLPSILPGYFAL